MSGVTPASSYNTLELVQSVVEDLVVAGFDIRVFGGWAEELQGLEAPRPHRDIDLLVIEPNEVLLDSYLHFRDEIGVKASDRWIRSPTINPSQSPDRGGVPAARRASN